MIKVEITLYRPILFTQTCIISEKKNTYPSIVTLSDEIDDQESRKKNIIETNQNQNQSVASGLCNPGNMNYANSVFQSLAHIPPLTNFFLTGIHSSQCSSRTRGCNQECILCILERLVKEIFSSRKKKIEMTSFLQHLKFLNKRYRLFHQNDAHEFFLDLLNISEIPKGAYISQFFSGKINTSFTCKCCQTVIVKEELFKDIALEILSSSSINSALYHHLKEEVIKAFCIRCKRNTEKTKRTIINQSIISSILSLIDPHILALVLKIYDKTGKKIQKRIQIDESINLNESTSNLEFQKKLIPYDLVAAIFHSGEQVEKGKYHCCFKGGNGFWFSMVNEEVKTVGIGEILSQLPYILFYMKSGNGTDQSYKLNEVQLLSTQDLNKPQQSIINLEDANRFVNQLFKNQREASQPKASIVKPKIIDSSNEPRFQNEFDSVYKKRLLLNEEVKMHSKRDFQIEQNKDEEEPLNSRKLKIEKEPKFWEDLDNRKKVIVFISRLFCSLLLLRS